MAAQLPHRLRTELTARVRRVLRGGALASSVLFAYAVHGADVRVIEESDTVDAQEITRIFAQPAPDATLPHTRNIQKILPGEPSPATGASGIALRVQFALDSAEIPAAGLRQLEVIADGLKPLSGAPRIVIEGYTDASGSEPHNLTLSLRRAEAVRAYLVSRGVTAGWLEARGNGSSAPARPGEPRAPENRRVELRRTS